jgi:hypothetical protein
MPCARSQPGAGQRAPRDELSRRLAGCTVTGDKRSARLVSLIGIFLANLAPLPFEIRQFFGWIGADEFGQNLRTASCACGMRMVMIRGRERSESGNRHPG